MVCCQKYDKVITHANTNISSMRLKCTHPNEISVSINVILFIKYNRKVVLCFIQASVGKNCHLLTAPIFSTTSLGKLQQTASAVYQWSYLGLLCTTPFNRTLLWPLVSSWLSNIKTGLFLEQSDMNHIHKTYFSWHTPLQFDVSRHLSSIPRCCKKLR